MVALESAELFCLLKPMEIAAVRRVAAERTFTVGQGVFREENPGDGTVFSFTIPLPTE